MAAIPFIGTNDARRLGGDATTEALTAPPSSPVTGRAYFADGVTWDPAGLANGAPYWCVYNGATYDAQTSSAPAGALPSQAESTLVGRPSGAGAGAPSALTATQTRTVLNVADGADVTATAALDATGGATGAVSRTLPAKLATLPVLDLHDFASLGSGSTKLSSGEVSTLNSDLSSPSGDKLLEADTEDTLDWAMFRYAIAAAVAQDGAVIQCARSTDYVIRRPIWLPDNVLLDLPVSSSIDNTYDDPGGSGSAWDTTHRTWVFAAGLWNPTQVFSETTGMTAYQLGASPLARGEVVIPFATAVEAGDFAPGDFCFVHTFALNEDEEAARYTAGARDIPKLGFIRRVVAADATAGTVTLDRGLGEDMPSSAAGDLRIAKFGTTGTLGTYGRPNGIVQRCGIVGGGLLKSTGQATSLITGENGWYEGYAEFRGEAAYQGVVANGICFPRVWDTDITVGIGTAATASGRIYEIKGYSEGRFEHAVGRQVSTTGPTTAVPAFALGEGSKIKVGDLYLDVRASNMQTAVLVASGELEADSITVVGTAGTLFQHGGHSGLARVPVLRARKLTLLASGAGVVRWMRLTGGMVPEIDDLTVQGTCTAGASQKIWCENISGGWLGRYSAPAGVLPNNKAFDAADFPLSPMAGYWQADAADLANAAHAVNTQYRLEGKPVWLRDSRKLQVPSTRTAGDTGWEDVGPPGGSLAVQDDGVSTVAAATTLNFVGASVTDAGSGVATVTITGGGSANTFSGGVGPARTGASTITISGGVGPR